MGVKKALNGNSMRHLKLFFFSQYAIAVIIILL
jgi:hypothetical protein